jgi:hypothetical protein
MREQKKPGAHNNVRKDGYDINLFSYGVDSEENGQCRIPAFGLEPVAHYRSLPIGALPLWRRELCSLLSPRRRGKILFPHPFKVRILHVANIYSTKSHAF